MDAGCNIDSQAKALVAAQAALDTQAEAVAVLDLRAISTVTDFFIVCTGTSARQIGALKDRIEEALAAHGSRVGHTEGSISVGGAHRSITHEFQWVLMDCGDVVVHLMDQEAREFYRLEDLWADAPRLQVPAGHGR